MLGREDQRRLKEIERELAAADPEFARRMRMWRSPAPLADRRWPLVALMLAWFVVGWLGALTVSLFWILFSAIGMTFAVVANCRQVRRRGRL